MRPSEAREFVLHGVARFCDSVIFQRGQIFDLWRQPRGKSHFWVAQLKSDPKDAGHARVSLVVVELNTVKIDKIAKSHNNVREKCNPSLNGPHRNEEHDVLVETARWGQSQRIGNGHGDGESPTADQRSHDKPKLTDCGTEHALPASFPSRQGLFKHLKLSL